VTVKNKIRPEIMKTLREAKTFHSHLGPFLVFGVRMGLIGIRELKVRRGDSRLHATANLTYNAPTSCILDGIQMTTGCTLGNTRLKLRETENISVKFRVKGKNSLTIKVKPSTLRKLPKKLMDKKLEIKEIENLAYTVASMPEENLFTISKAKRY